ncbi:MAG: hypothetical protein ACD_4C00283G0005 [uncultured bacterium (gcode 4)]|uniref:Restriction endonuclease n=1 Tax=uncultured bacterium (gcode 4) TaxID=1234023 RepID=K2G8J7_9BACT|nr:MAG: hypothetical protein ACD_4C00283G0005 [uncultured bacterium (gcode 4)]
MTKKKSKLDLFVEFAKPDENWVSKWINKTDFKWDYASLYFDNWFPWWRWSAKIKFKYILEVRKDITPWNRIDAIRLNWFNTKINLNQWIRKDIIDEITNKRCIVLGTHTSWDYKTAPDHKDWRKNNLETMNTKTQKIEDFQPLSKPANDAKRQFCKECKKSWQRYDATKLWYPVSVVKWDLQYDEKLWCKGCFWYDPIEFRKNLKFSWK